MPSTYVGFWSVIQNTGEMKQRLQDTKIYSGLLSIGGTGSGNHKLLATVPQIEPSVLFFLSLAKVTDSSRSHRACRKDGRDIAMDRSR